MKLFNRLATSNFSSMSRKVKMSLHSARDASKIVSQTPKAVAYSPDISRHSSVVPKESTEEEESYSEHTPPIDP